MKTALFTLVALAGLAIMGTTAEAAPHGGYFHSGGHYSGGHGHHHHGGYPSNYGYRSYAPSYNYGHGHHDHHYRGGYNRGYGYPSSGIGFSGRNFSFYYGF